jgi:4-hydroxy-3-methylbut-2-enyl diphosphate reductase
MLVVGGYNSSNTRNLAKISDKQLPTFHIADAEELVSRTTIRHRPITASLESSETMTGSDWLPSQGPLSVGLTAGASTPNNIVGQVVDRLEQFTAEPVKT